MTQILLVGSDEPLLEGLTQSLSAMGHTTRVAHTVSEAREMALTTAPLVAVIERAMLHETGDPLGIPLASGGALVLYHGVGTPAAPLSYSLQRQVLAELTLPLERNRLASLVQHVRDRAVVTGRGHVSDPSERAEL